MSTCSFVLAVLMAATSAFAQHSNSAFNAEGNVYGADSLTDVRKFVPKKK